MNAATHLFIINRAVNLLEANNQERFAAFASRNGAEYEVNSPDSGPDVLVCGDFKALLGIIDIGTQCSKLFGGFSVSGNYHHYDVARNSGFHIGDVGVALQGLMNALGHLLLPIASVDVYTKPPLQSDYPSAAELCQKEYNNALRAWYGKELEPIPYEIEIVTWDRIQLAVYHLARACHYIADCCTPPHTKSDLLGAASNEDGDYEAMAQSLVQDADAIATKDEYLAARSAFAGKTAFEIAKTAAQETNAEFYPAGLSVLLGVVGAVESSSPSARASINAELRRAEAFTAVLLDKFFTEVRVSAEPPPVRAEFQQAAQARPFGTVTKSALPYSHLFYRRRTNGQPTDWSHTSANVDGVLLLPLDPNDPSEVYELRPAMPGYRFQGDFINSLNLEVFEQATTPSVYRHRDRALTDGATLKWTLSKVSSLTQRMPQKRLAPGGTVSGPRVWTAEPREEVASSLSREPLVLRDRVRRSLEMQLDVLVGGEPWPSTPRLSPGGPDVYICIGLSRLFNPATMDFVRSLEEVIALQRERISPKVGQRPTQGASRPQVSPEVADAMRRLGLYQQSVSRVRAVVKGGRQAAPRQLSPGVRPLPQTTINLGFGELKGLSGLVPLPAPPGSQIRVQLVPDWGCVGVGERSPVSVTTTIGSRGLAWVLIRAGTELGILRLRIEAVEVPGMKSELLPFPRTVDLTVFPDSIGGTDPASITPPTLEPMDLDR